MHVHLIFPSGKAKEAETKRRVTAIHELKDQLKTEKDSLNDIKQRLRDAQERQREEKEIATGQAMDKGSAEMRQMAEVGAKQVTTVYTYRYRQLRGKMV